MNGVVFIPDRNHTRKDFEGAFLPEALSFSEIWGSPKPVKIDISLTAQEQRAQVLQGIKDASWAQGTLRMVAFFCHGWKAGIQLGFNLDTAQDLAKQIACYSTRNVVIPIYACSAARDNDPGIADDIDPDTVGGDGGFADILRDALCWEDKVHCRIMAHVTSGHTTRNPWVRYFEGTGNPYGGSGGAWVIRPKGPLWARWIKWLAYKDNRLKFPFETANTLRQEVGRFTVS